MINNFDINVNKLINNSSDIGRNNDSIHNRSNFSPLQKLKTKSRGTPLLINAELISQSSERHRKQYCLKELKMIIFMQNCLLREDRLGITTWYVWKQEDSHYKLL